MSQINNSPKKMQPNPIEEELDLLRFSIDNASDAFFLMGPNAGFIYVNDAAVRHTGYSRQELLQMDVHDIDPNFPSERWPEHWDEVKAQGHFTLDTLHRRKDGKMIPVEVTVNYLKFKKKEYNCAFAKDVVAHKKSEKIQSSIYQISEAAHSSSNLNELYQRIHEIITELMPAKNNFYIALFNQESDLLEFPYFVDERDKKPAPRKLMKGLTEYVLRTGRPLLAPPEIFKDLKQKGEVSLVGRAAVDWLGVPLKVKEKCIGVLAVQSYTPGVRFSREDKNILMFISEQVAMAITRRQAEEALHEREELYRSVVENSHHGILIIDDAFRFVYANDELFAMTGYSEAELKRKDVREFLDQENREFVTELCNLRLAGEEIPPRYVLRFQRKDGTERWGEASSSVVKDTKNNIQIVVQIQDITDRKKDEERIQNSLREKEVMLQEIHHRVKNNLQIISSLINLQSRHLHDLHAIDKFEESRRRVKSMAIVHEKLYCSGSLSQIDFSDYLRSLAGHLFQMYTIETGTVGIQIDSDPIFLDINTAIPCGLMVSELLSNALKHAFPEGRAGKIRIEMMRLPDDSICIRTADDGIGLPPDFDLKTAESFGMQLVDMLAEQLRGTIEIDTSAGTSIAVVFKELKNLK